MLEKSLALRQAKLYFRRNGKVLAAPSPAEAENHIDFLQMGKECLSLPMVQIV